MAFRFVLASAPQLMGPPATVELEGESVFETLDLPRPGEVLVRAYVVPPSGFQLRVRFAVADDRVGVKIGNLGGDDALAVVAVPHALRPGTLFAGTVAQAAPQNEHCSVRCDDGTTGECCVECRAGDVTVKICC
jgi:hypothetical protein